MEKPLVDILWVTLSAALVFVMQGGFLCLEAGLTRSKNSINVAIKNLTDFGISVLLYWAFGFAVMFGLTTNGWFGTTHFFVGISEKQMWLSAFFLYQAMFCGTAVTIVSGGAAERLRFVGYIFVAIIVSGLIYPLFGHWAWGGAYEGGAGWLAARGFVDFAGSSVVHSVGGWVTLAIVLVVGARTGRFSKERTTRNIPNSNLPQAMLGVLLLWFGWIGFNGGSTFEFNNQVPSIIVKTILAGGAGMLVTLLVGWRLYRYPNPLLVMNGSLAGLVSITANVHAISATDAIIIGGIGGVVMLMAEKLLERFQIDDVVGAFPVHGAAGVWGTLAVGIFCDLETLGTGLSRWQQITTQLLGVVVCATISFGIAYVLLSLINRIYPLRVSLEDEHRGLNVSEHKATTEVYDLFTTLEEQEKTKNLNLRVPVEPFTIVGQIAQRYNDVMDSLQESIGTTEAIVKSAKDAIVTFMQSGSIITFVNPSAEAIFGYPANKIVGKSVTMLLPDKQKSFELLRKAVNIPIEGSPQKMVGQRCDGSEFPMDASVSKGQSSKGDFYTVVFRDITERENALKSKEKLEAQIRRAQKLDSIGTMASGIAHNFNTLLGAIRGFIDMAHADIPDANSRVKSDLEKAMQAIGDAKEISDQMLTFSRGESHKFERIKIYPIVKESVELFTVSIDGSIDVSLKCDTKESLVVANQNQIKQIVLNLCTNAYHAMSEAGGHLEINLKEVNVDASMVKDHSNFKIGKYVQIIVKDSGIGMDKETIDRIFEPFFTTKEVGKGTGLGLSVIHGIVMDHHGEITVDSQPNKGTAFNVYLPLIKNS